MGKKRAWVLILLLLAVLSGCGGETPPVLKDAAVEDAILYPAEEGLIYNAIYRGDYAKAVITDETGNGIDSPEALAAVLGIADAPEPVCGTVPGERTLGKAVTADITTDGKGRITALRVKRVTVRPVVGISWKSDTVGEDYRAFAESLERNGGIAVYLPLLIAPEQAEAELSRLDSLLVTGGEDWNPGLYGQGPEPHGAVDWNDIRDMSDLHLIRATLKMDIPMLCICRGAQGLNIALGGGLIQDIPTYLGTQVEQGLIAESRVTGVLSEDGCGCTGESHLRIQLDGIIHEGNTYHHLEAGIDPDSKWLYDIFGTDSLDLVSTAHHQAIDPERIGDGLTVAARSADGIIEAVEYRENRFVLGLQWHPERDALGDSQDTDVSQELSNLPLRALVEFAGESEIGR